VKVEPYLYPVLAIVLGFFLVVTNFLANPFAVLDHATTERLVQSGRATLDASGRVADGSGLNPLLNNYWMLIHPPSLYLGFTGFTVPFAFAAAALLSGELGLFWIRATRAWTMIAWLFLTNGIILGGLWAYEVLGWGGYWAWDPVENASFVPWLTATAFLHTVMVVERRNMLKRWNMSLVFVTFFLTLVGTYLTRSGVVASVHSFSASTLGDWFFAFLAFVAFGGGALLVLRNRELASPYRIRSLASREAAFLFNNLVLVGLAGAILFLTIWPTISANLLGRELSIGPPTYALVTTPLFAILVLLTAIGPGVGWVRSTPRLLRRNFLLPAVAAVGVVAFLLLFWVLRREPVAFYPPVLVGFATFAFGSAVNDFVRGVRARRATRAESPVRALARLSVANNRRYGGYVVHIGFCLVVLGIVGSAFFGEKQDVKLAIGDRVQVAGGRYELAYVGELQGDTGVFTRDVQHFTVYRDGEPVTDLYPERRFYRKKEQATTEVAIYRNRWSPFFDDLYVFFAGRDPSGERNIFTIFHNPLINWIWVGWIVTLAGGVFAALPMRRKRRVGLAE
jgi:cytochrome c-type biogenesis protein CcmF